MILIFDLMSATALVGSPNRSQTQDQVSRHRLFKVDQMKGQNIKNIYIYEENST